MSKQIHLIMPFSRPENKGKLVDAYRAMEVKLHPIMFMDEATDFENETWIFPAVIPMHSSECKVMMPGCYKRNWWLNNNIVMPDDYYVTVDDDDMYEVGVFDEIRKMDDDIVIISMKRGTNTPTNVIPDREYPTNTLLAHPDHIEIGSISAQQSFVKGRIFGKHRFRDDIHQWDGEIAVHHKKAGEQIAYRPDLFCLFNFYEPGRWEGLKISFGVMVDDWTRFGQVFQQSQITGEAHFIKQPESATKGLNTLLEIMEGEGADVAVLSHQDMHYKADWMARVQKQIAKLPDNWIVAGIIGKDLNGKIAGVFRDMRIPNYFDTSDVHEFPQPASCFDECVIIVNLKKGFRFDESLDGFDLYGSLCVLQSRQMGGTAWIINAYAEHYCLRPFTWYPDETYCSRFKWLWEKYHEVGRVDTTAIGFKNEANKAA